MSRRPLAFALLVGACSDYGISGKGEANGGPGPAPKDSGAPADLPDDTAPPPDDTGPPPIPDCADFPAPAAPSPGPDPGCLRAPAPGVFDPVVEWNSDVDLGYAVDPSVKHPYVMPAVGQLSDDNGDGRVDRLDVPDIAWTCFEGGGGPGSGLRVVSGDGSAEHLYVPSVTFGGRDWAISRQGGVAIGDIDADGSPDLVTIVMFDADTARVAALERDGRVKWVEPTGVTSRYSYPSLADLDADGFAEVVVGHLIIDTDGTLIAAGAGGTGAPDSRPNPTWGSVSIPVDLDLDGRVEIVAGNTIYDAAGAILASSGLADGFTAVADLDLDGVAEVVTSVHSTGEVYAWAADGTVLWRTATGSGGGGPPTVADFDADGLPEIGVAGRSAYSVLEPDGSVRWTSAITDVSSSATGSSVYDFDGDGAFEVVFADEVRFAVFDGATGAVLFEDLGHAHGTAWEYPVVADVDGDGQVEIALGSVSTAGEWNGITVLGSASGSWTPARPVWNQHAYHITNVTEDGAIPPVAAPNWATWNTFRAAGPEAGPATWLPDLGPVDAAVCTDTCALNEVTLYLRLQNGGLIAAESVVVDLIDEAGARVSRQSAPLLPAGGGAVLGPLTLDRAAWGPGALRAVVDPDDLWLECDEADNTVDLGPWPCLP